MQCLGRFCLPFNFLIQEKKNSSSFLFIHIIICYLRYGRFFSLPNGLLVSNTETHLHILDLRTKRLLMQHSLYQASTILVPMATKKKKYGQAQKVVILVSNGDSELRIQVGRTVSIEGLFEQALIGGETEKAMNIMEENNILQNIENLKKLEKMLGGNHNDRLMLLAEGIEKELMKSEKIKKIDFFSNIIRREDLRILKDRTKVIEKKSFKLSSENYFKISDVVLLNTQKPNHLKRIIAKNYSVSRERKSFTSRTINKSRQEIINFVNSKVQDIFRKKESIVFRTEFRQKTEEFLKINYQWEFKRLLWECLKFEDHVLSKFLIEYHNELKKFREFDIFVNGVAGLRFERTLGDFRSATIFVSVANFYIREWYGDLVEGFNGVWGGGIKENGEEFLEIGKKYLSYEF